MRRWRRCRCPGHWTTRRERWRVLETRGEWHTVYCLRCHARWTSKANYLVDWPTHKVKRRNWGKLTDEDVLQMINDGLIRVRVVDGKSVIESRGKPGSREPGPWKERRTRIHDFRGNGAGYEFVGLARESKRIEITVGKVVWMYANRRVVPEGFQIDHRNTDTLDNQPGNLRLLPHYINQSAGRGVDRRDEYEEAF